MKRITDEWISKVDRDYRAAQMVLQMDEPLTDVACFHSQQCAEKYLKAFLQEHEVEFPRSHALTLLLDLCLAIDSTFEMLRRDLIHLDNYAVAVRYPGVEVSLELAQAALTAATRVRAFLRAKLEMK